MNTDHVELPELSDQRLDEIERALLSDIRRERTVVAAKRQARRRRAWLSTGVAAAVVLVAAVVGPSLSGSVGSGALTTAEEGAFDAGRDDTASQGEGAGGAEALSSDDLGASEGTDAPADAAAGAREVIATASVTLETAHAEKASEEISRLVAEAGGYVEALRLSENGASGDAGAGKEIIDPFYPGGDAWITVRIPADELTAVTAALSDVGEVRSSEIQRDDVTSQVVDLRARVAALRASVDRLRELIADAASTADLLAAEDALAERQAELDSLQAQLTVLDDQVALSSLTVTLIEPAPAVAADPGGFGDGLGAGWNALWAAVNGIVIGIGFLLPWLALIAVVALIVWGVRRIVRRRRADVPDAEGRDLLQP